MSQPFPSMAGRSSQFNIIATTHYKKTAKYRKQTDICDVISVLDGGAAVEVRISGAELPMDRVPVVPKTTVMKGDRVIIRFAEANRNLPYIKGRPITVSTVVTMVGSWYQFHRELTLAGMVSVNVCGNSDNFAEYWINEVHS
jgi:hypothetical protein